MRGLDRSAFPPYQFCSPQHHDGGRRMSADSAGAYPLTVGQVAPDFTLDDENGNPVLLSGLRGRPVVLVFYPFDWSPLCTDEICSVRDRETAWEREGAQVFGI